MIGETKAGKKDTSVAVPTRKNPNPNVINWPDLLMSVELIRCDEIMCEWRIVSHAQVSDANSDAPSRLMYLADNCEPVDDVAKADTIAHGDTKWDGCTNFSAGGPDNGGCMIHTCGKSSLGEVLEAIRRADAAAFEAISNPNKKYLK